MLLPEVYLILAILAPIGTVLLRLALARSVHRAIIAKPEHLKEVSFEFGLKPRLTARWTDEDDLPPPAIEEAPTD